jgi:hypothetical protein
MSSSDRFKPSAPDVQAVAEELARRGDRPAKIQAGLHALLYPRPGVLAPTATRPAEPPATRAAS